MPFAPTDPEPEKPIRQEALKRLSASGHPTLATTSISTSTPCGNPPTPTVALAGR